MHILVSLSCANSFCGVQNQSFFQFVSLVSVIFSNRKLQLVGNYIHKMVIKFVFCAVSLLWTSRYVLINYTPLTHFLCCNSFVILCWISSVISVNVLEIRLLITNVYFSLILLTVHFLTNTVVAVSFRDFRECSQNLLEPPCCTDFYEVCYPFYPPLWGTTWESVAVLANFANLLKTHAVFRRTCRFFLKC